MKYLFTLLLFATVQLAHAQASLLINGVRLATQLGVMAARSNKHKAPPMPHVAATAEEAAAAAAAAAATIPNVAPIPPASNSEFAYHGQRIARQRTEAKDVKGKGITEIMALEVVLEQTHQALLADSMQSFLPAAQLDVIRAVARRAAAARYNWNFAPYQHELGFYQYEEARRAALAPAPATNSGQ
ncbi:hypothetical protein D0N36_11190 [Hymenobacter lapidiphilus]|uniref:hypothetical protein n=1 Tax=Hymenobacter sp. CCM 8763 TaxID=2303334 RepID=UPI000E34DB49|nr:hypothetical protein [Hymenobacter sp. CCM 8763]RFP65059.1 hypothetical protein D0N36_11190 [Hymenobacter sp. CCM 8763]